MSYLAGYSGIVSDRPVADLLIQHTDYKAFWIVHMNLYPFEERSL